MSKQINEVREYMIARLNSEKRILQAKLKLIRDWPGNLLYIDVEINEAILEEIELQLQELQIPAPVEENKPEEYGISEEKVQELYNAVHTPIMDARITIAKILKGAGKKEEADVDAILYHLCLIVPQAAIDYFKK